MATPKKNKFISQQNKARKELLMVKKQGYVGKENPRTKKEELTTSGKIGNFLHYNKVVIGFIIFALIAAIVSVLEFTKKVDYDINVVIYTYNTVSDDQSQKIEKYFEKYVTDINGDGKVRVQAVNCSYNKGGDDIEYMNYSLQKLAAQLSGGDKSILFITDVESYEELNNRTDIPLFDCEAVALKEEFYKETSIEYEGNIITLPEGLGVCYRRVKGTILEKEDVSHECYKEAKKVIERLK